MAVARKLMTAGELERMPDDGCRYELVQGELVRMAPVNLEHGQIALRFGARLLAYVEARGLGAVAVETGYRLVSDPDTVRGPDVSFVAAARVPTEGRSKGFLGIAPDLGVEVVSPDDTAAEIEGKVQDYLAAGTRMVLVVHPRTRTVTAYRPDGSARVLRAGETIDGEDVVPGFSLPVRELFAP